MKENGRVGGEGEFGEVSHVAVREKNITDSVFIALVMFSHHLVGTLFKEMETAMYSSLLSYIITGSPLFI
jgi:hypothetical protein